MTKVYSDYFREVMITVPERFIDVKTGESHAVPSLIQEQIAYHAKNNTLVHLLYSALYQYFYPVQSSNQENIDILKELFEIKEMLQVNHSPHHVILTNAKKEKKAVTESITMQDIEEIVEAYGG